MPHIIVKVWPGHSPGGKTGPGQALVQDTVGVWAASPGWVSVDIQEVPEERWDEEVFQPEIAGPAGQPVRSSRRAAVDAGYLCPD